MHGGTQRRVNLVAWERGRRAHVDPLRGHHYIDWVRPAGDNQPRIRQRIIFQLPHTTDFDVLDGGRTGTDNSTSAWVTEDTEEFTCFVMGWLGISLPDEGRPNHDVVISFEIELLRHLVSDARLHQLARGDREWAMDRETAETLFAASRLRANHYGDLASWSISKPTP